MGDVQREANERTRRRNKVSCKSFILKDLERTKGGNGAVCSVCRYWSWLEDTWKKDY